jgi:hypothetical protein
LQSLRKGADRASEMQYGCGYSGESRLDEVVRKLRKGETDAIPVAFDLLERGANFLLKRFAGESADHAGVVRKILQRAIELAVQQQFESGSDMSAYVLKSLRQAAVPDQVRQKAHPPTTPYSARMERISAVIERLSVRDRGVVQSFYSGFKNPAEICAEFKLSEGELHEILARVRALSEPGTAPVPQTRSAGQY